MLWTDVLPPDLATGLPRALAYRVELRNEAGRSAGLSQPVFVAAGQEPAQVQSLRGDGSRLGILLRWTADADDGEVLLDRTAIDASPSGVSNSARRSASSARLPRKADFARQGRSQTIDTPGSVWFQAAPGARDSGQTIDSTAAEGIAYRYVAVRRVILQVAGRQLELRGAPSPAVEVTWRDVYPPPAPQGLAALGYLAPDTSLGSSPPSPTRAYAVDLVWQPVNDPRLAGYLVDRVVLDAQGQPQGSPERLTSQPVTTPALHDATASRSQRYRYEVRATDAKGNVSSAATASVEATQR